MNKAFTKESDGDDEDDIEAGAPALPPGAANYMTRRSYNALRAELEHLVKTERPDLVKVVAWAAGNGDRSENGDYLYGKKRLREIDKRMRFLLKRTENAVVVDAETQQELDQVFFGATVSICDTDGSNEATYQIVGVDEANATEGKISWISRWHARLIKGREGDVVRFQSPAGQREIEILEIKYV